MIRIARGLAYLVMLATASAASAHEVLHAVERGRAIAVKAYFSDGEALAYMNYEVYSPEDTKIPYQKGRTDRGGYLAFVPDAAGNWRVKVSDNSGHGFDIEIDSSMPADPAQTRESAAAITTVAFVLRPLLGLVVIAVVFGGLFALYRRRVPTR